MGRLLHLLLYVYGIIVSGTSTSDIYSIKLKDIEGNDVSMEDYKGKVSLREILIVTSCKLIV